MRAAKIVLVVWLLCELGLWIREGLRFSVLDALPFAQRSQYFSPDYEWLALGALLIGLWGYAMIPRSAAKQQAGSRLRAEILLVPLTIIGLAALSRRYVSTLHFADIVGDPARLTEDRHLSVLCVCVFATLLAVKVFRNRF